MTLTHESIIEQSVLFTSDNHSFILIYNQWRFFYSLTGDSAPFNTVSSNHKNIPDYVVLMLYKFETARILLIESFKLRDFLKSGFFHEKGAKYIDIYIKNIPREHGIASGLVYDETYDLLNGTGYQGKSLKITIHRNLIKKTATPIHELFHLFQYSYTHFNNMWFMEGLARWSQSIMQVKPGTGAPLPKTLEELDILVHKKHDAEFFFNHLISLCEEGDSFKIPLSLKNNSEIYNNKKTGSSFMKVFLENCELQYKFMQKELKSRDIQDTPYWKRDEKRSTNNNQYIFKAIIDTIDTVCKDKNEELINFIDLIYPLAHITIEDYNIPQIQSFLKVMQKYDEKFVLLSKNGILYSEFFDIFTGTVSSRILDFTSSNLTDDELDSFKVIKRINGPLVLKNCTNLSNLNGLRNVETIEGDLILTGTKLKKLNELNNLISVNRLHIAFMDNLESISGFNELVNIKSNLLISNNKKLALIKGFNSLESAANIEIVKTELASCDFLRGVFQNNSVFKGHIKIYSNKLENIEFMAGVTDIQSSFFLHLNRLEDLKGLEELQSIGGSLSLSGNRLTSLKPLKNLEKINGLLAISYNRLKTLDGLENLKSLVTKKWSDTYFTIKMYENRDLTDISALKNLQIKGDFIILGDRHHIHIKHPESNSKFNTSQVKFYDAKKNELYLSYKQHHESSLKVLFPIMGNNWMKNIVENHDISSFFLKIDTIDLLIDFYIKNDMDCLMATNKKFIDFINKYRETLLSHDIQFLSPENYIVNKLYNKNTFYNSMHLYHLDMFIPEVYDDLQNIKYPAIIKKEVGSGGKDQYIIHSDKDLKEIQNGTVVSEYIQDNKEYATNILFYNQQIHYHCTYEKYTTDDDYILGIGDESYYNIKDKRVETPYIDLFRKILTLFKYEGFCCIDYKIKDQKLKIFEINPRVGFSFSMHQKDFYDGLEAYKTLLNSINKCNDHVKGNSI